MKTQPTEVISRDLVALLERFRAGDPVAYGPLDKACRRRVYRWLRKTLPNPKLRAECDDAVQAALIRLVRGSESFRTDQHLLKWLRITAKRKATNAERRRRPKQLPEFSTIELVRQASDQPDDVEPGLQALRECFPKLGLKHQVVLVMHYCCHLSAAQLARLLHAKRCTILARLRRARLKLRDLMEEHESWLAA